MKKPLQFDCPHCGKPIVLDRTQTKQFEQAIWPSISKQMSQETNLKIKEKEKIISDLKKQLGLALRKAEQIPNELQGSVQEIEVAKILTETHPHDDVQRIRKGGNGADLLQTVKTQGGKELGRIYYESKSCQGWSNAWIPKLKKDNLAAKANALVIVTQSLPREVKKFALIDGVWVCDLSEIKEFSFILRYLLIKLGDAIMFESDKENKMAQLYRYMTSDEFKTVLHAIFDGFENLQQLHAAEKLKMQKIWKEREITLEQILSSSIELHGYLGAIIGSSIAPAPKSLSLPLQD